MTPPPDAERLFRGLEAATCCPPADEAEGWYARACFPLTAAELTALVRAGALAHRPGADWYGLTDAGWARLRARMRGAASPPAKVEYPADF